ncbi:MAG TPA: hypothetical protein VFX78_06495 [Candidatus Eisenbacteria bacterium]|nr:hypothetical protein [Candidatus Eisenbacteria bacterium]
MNPSYQALLERLRAARRIILLRAIERAGIATVVGLLAVALLALAIALVAPLYRAEYAAIRSALLGAAVLFVLAAVARVWSTKAALPQAAIEAGRLGGDREDDLLAALELSQGAQGDDAWTSASLREVAVRAAAERAQGLPIERLRRWDQRGRWLAASGGVLLLLAVTGVLGGSRTPMVIQRIARPASAPIAPIKIRVEPGNREIEGGETVSIRAYVAGTPRHPKLLTRSGDGWKDASFDDAPSAEGARSGEHVYAATLRNVKEDVTYKIKIADQETPVFALSVRDLPRATGYRIRYDYPAYTGLKSEEAQAITADLAAPRGTRATIDVGTNRAVDDAAILLDGGGRIAGSGGDHGAQLTVPIRNDGRFSIRLTDRRGRRALLGPFELRAIPDRPPTVTVLSPGPVDDVGHDMGTTILAGATDDHGVRKILLRYKVREEAVKVETLHEEKAGARELAIRYGWALGSYGLLPGDEIEYQVGAVDGNAVDGPQTTWSDTRRLRFPSATEILANMERERSESIDTLEDVLKNVRDLQQKSEDLSRDVGRTKELTWEQKQELQKNLEGQQRAKEQLDKVAEKLSQDAEKLSQSPLRSELVQKIEELHQLLSQIKDQSLLKSMQRLQEAMKKMTPQEMERALQNFQLSQDEVIKNLERTIEMLKQLKTEEMLEAASQRAAEMERRQLAVNDSLSRAQGKDQKSTMNQLSNSQKQLSDMSKEQSAALDSIAAQMKPDDAETAEQAKQLAEQYGEKGMQQDMQQMSGSMEAGEQDQAQQEAKQLSKNLEQMRKSVDKMREGFRQKKKNELAKKMEDAAQDLMDIASVQEKLLADDQSSMNDRAETQKGLQETTEGATERIGQMAKQSLFITPDIAQSLGRALTNQSNAVGRYSNQDLAGGLNASKEATISLNQAATGLLRQKESMQGAKSSTGMQEAMESLQSLAGQQQGVNEQTMGMMPGQQDGMGSGDQGQRLQEGAGQALGRMAAEQEAIRKGLEETMQKMNQSGGSTLGNMGDVAEEMKKVEQDLRSGRLEADTVERQQKILSRLLDAPRSVEKRDYSRKRTSRPGLDVVRSSPEALSGDLLKSKPSLAALLARGSRDPIAPRYRATVDEYFQSILEGKAR